MIKIGFIAFDMVQAMDLIAPYELLEVWQNSINETFIELLIVGGNKPIVSCANKRFSLSLDCLFEDAPQFDYLFIPGGIGRRESVNDTNLINFIRTQAEGTRKTLSVCTGSFLLQAAGLLEEEFATTYWRALPEFAKKHNQIQEERIVKGNNVWTAGGISSGIDLALELIDEIAGKEQANLARLCFEYFPLSCSQNINYRIDKLKPYFEHINSNSDIAKYIMNR